MLTYWIAQEYYRLHVVEQWPDSSHKAASLAAIHSKLESLVDRQPPIRSAYLGQEQNLAMPPSEPCNFDMIRSVELLRSVVPVTKNVPGFALLRRTGKPS